MFGLSPSDWKLLEDLCLKPLRERGAKLWVFGSRARGDFRPFSDIDLLYEVTPSLTLTEISEIREQLEESDLTIKVDLVDIRDLSESFRAQAIKERKPLTRSH